MVIEKAVKAEVLPQELRAGVDPAATVLVSVRLLTENGFTEEFEQRVLAAEQEADLSPVMTAEEFIEELKNIIAADEHPHD